MGGCQSEENQISSPKKIASLLQPKKKKIEKHKFDVLAPLNYKLETQTSNGKITDFIAKYKQSTIKYAYQQGDINKNLDNAKKYIDKYFGNDQKYLGFRQLSEQIDWKRPSQFIKDNYTVFQGSIKPQDIKQGKLNNSYFLSALASITSSPFIINRILETTSSTNGSYGIWLFIDGLWTCVVIDDRIPITNSKSKPLFSKNEGNQIWVMLMQKSYAKIFGSYESIESGLVGMAMNAFTGAPFEYLSKDSNNKIDANAAWDFITSHTSMNHILTGSTQNNDRNASIGVISTYSYTILCCKQIQVSTLKGKKKERILQLSNPWGRYQWQGRWSGSSDIWTEQLKQQLKYQNSNDHVFWINIDDFMQNFGQVCSCNYNKNYINTSLPLTFSETQNNYKFIFLSTTSRSQGYITLYQKDHRFFREQIYEYSLVRLIILQINLVSKSLTKYMNDMMDCDRISSLAVQLQPGDYYIIIEMDWKCNLTRNTVLNFYGQHPVAFIEDKNPPNISQLFNEIVTLHENYTEQDRVYKYQKDQDIKRITGTLAGYVYYHYINKSKNSNYLSETIQLTQRQFIQVCGEEDVNQFLVKVNPDQEKIVKLKVQKEGNSYYSFSTKIQFYIVEKYSIERLKQLANKKSTKVKKRQIEGKQIDVFIKCYNYKGGIAMLYQNKMQKYTYVQQLILQIENLELQNEIIPKNNKLQIELQPQSQKLLSFIVCSPGKEVVFKTKVSFYLNSPDFQF